MFYAIVVLNKISLSTQSPESGLNKLLDIDNINLVDYLFKIMTLLKDTAGSQKGSVPAAFYLIVTRLTAWNYRICTPHLQDPADEVLEPMTYLRTTDEDIHHEKLSHSRRTITFWSDKF